MLLCLVMFSSGMFARADDNYGTGDWWLKQDRNTKATFVLGFWDGQEHAARQMAGFMLFTIPDSKPGQKKLSDEQNMLLGFSKLVEANYNKHRQRTVGVSAGNFVEGIDTVFSDYRFRRLFVKDVMNAVEASLSGKSKDDVEAMLEEILKLRANADD